ncbi:hypothetical protein SLNSH_14985 [Alsobacter soli]|uniref:Uncharacterized protein n=1 Tax=Alsobacter soli TaxID=2109933 RepID=A0A2T1HRL9_9HYPH|nr:hypothetical protein [Alsobacter soli]PSC04290.1 hypothetical protein SLNSH_14985 [Alsobacter soli]
MSEAATLKADAPLHPVNGAASARPSPQDSAIIDGLSRVLLADSKQAPDMPRLLQHENKRLLAVTRVVNAFHNYLATVANRQMDEISASDVARLGMILKILEDIEPSDRLRRV